jgi:hypothetical protein
VGRGCIVGACTTAGDCDDSIECTVDECGVGNVCSNQPVDALCGDLERCDPASGCLPSGECLTAADCVDTVACTVDNCAVGNVCVHAPNNGLCAPGEICDPGTGCFVSVPCITVADCSGTVDNFCDGEPRCDPEFGCRPPAAPRDCDDHDDCTIDTCDTVAEMCTYAVNCALAECFAANPNCLWNGCFDLDSTISQRCTVAPVRFDIHRVCFELRGPTLNMRVETGLAALTQAPAPAGMDFDVSLQISGGCIEDYRLAGTLSDADHFTATWTATYTDHDGFSCAFGGCPAQNIVVNGTRVP